MLVLALLLTSSATTSSCLSFSEIGAGREYRPDSFASEYRALRADDECGHYWFEFENTAVKLVDSGLELRGGTQVALEFDVDPTVEVLVETARHRGGRWESSPRDFGGPRPWFTRLSDYRRLCTGPCTVQLGEGRHYFALAHPAGVLAEVPRPAGCDQGQSRTYQLLDHPLGGRVGGGWRPLIHSRLGCRHRGGNDQRCLSRNSGRGRGRVGELLGGGRRQHRRPVRLPRRGAVRGRATPLSPCHLSLTSTVVLAALPPFMRSRGPGCSNFFTNGEPFS